RLRRPVRPGVIADEVPLVSCERLEVVECCGRRGQHKRGERGPDRETASHGTRSVEETPAARPWPGTQRTRYVPGAAAPAKLQAPDVSVSVEATVVQAVPDCCWSCTTAPVSTGLIAP